MEETRIQTAMTVAAVAFAIAALGPTGGVTYHRHPIVPVVLMLSSFLLGMTAIFEVWNLGSRERRSSIGTLELGIWLLVLGLLIRFGEMLRVLV